ncbi:MAG: hypothetical protein ACM3YM_08020 [Sphingomonadales bacterium]
MPVSMLVFFVIVAIPIVLIGVAGDVMKRWIKLKERQLNQTAHLAAEKAAAQAMHVDKLERRVRVLERIATDRGVDLAHEIDTLGDGKPN